MSPGYTSERTAKSEAEGVGQGSQFDQNLRVKGRVKAHRPSWGSQAGGIDRDCQGT